MENEQVGKATIDTETAASKIRRIKHKNTQ